MLKSQHRSEFRPKSQSNTVNLSNPVQVQSRLDELLLAELHSASISDSLQISNSIIVLRAYFGANYAKVF